MGIQSRKPKDLSEAFMIKQENIQRMVNDKDLNIRVSWAINCSVEVVKLVLPLIAEGKIGSESVKDKSNLIFECIDKNTDYFLNLFNRKRDEIVNKKARELEKEEQHFQPEDFESNAPLDE